MFVIKERAKAAALHFVLSVAVAAVVAAVIFLVWYPYPFREISGGRHLFFIVIVVDVIIGPLITFAVFDRTKGWAVLKKDLLIVALLQLAALGYGAWTVYAVRPVHVIYEYDRFKVVHAIDVSPEALEEAPIAYRTLPLGGPTLLSLRKTTAQETQQYLMAEVMGGESLSVVPALWQPYEAARDAVLRQARPVAELKARFPAEAARIDKAVQAAGRPAIQLVYAPLVGRDEFWTVLLDSQTAEPLQYLPVDPF